MGLRPTQVNESALSSRGKGHIDTPPDTALSTERSDIGPRYDPPGSAGVPPAWGSRTHAKRRHVCATLMSFPSHAPCHSERSEESRSVLQGVRNRPVEKGPRHSCCGEPACEDVLIINARSRVTFAVAAMSSSPPIAPLRTPALQLCVTSLGAFALAFHRGQPIAFVPRPCDLELNDRSRFSRTERDSSLRSE